MAAAGNVTYVLDTPVVVGNASIQNVDLRPAVDGMGKFFYMRLISGAQAVCEVHMDIIGDTGSRRLKTVSGATATIEYGDITNGAQPFQEIIMDRDNYIRLILDNSGAGVANNFHLEYFWVEV